MATELHANDRVAHFIVRERLGAGGMGVVYLAHDENLERDVALKVLPPAFASDDERRGRFLREAKSAARMVHPNIATVFEVGESEGRLFIAMEYVAGQSLGAVLAGGPTAPGEAARIARGVTRGLVKAHSLGIVHRDIKPDNVMLTSDGQVKVLDFGLAKLRAEETEASTGASVTELEQLPTASNMTATGRIMGTPGYMSPEQARGQAVDHRTDLFAVGVMLYEMVAGEQPFGGTTPLDKLAAVTRDDVPTLDAEPEIDAVIKRCLEKKRDDRYADGESLLEALEALAATDIPRPRRNTGSAEGDAAQSRGAQTDGGLTAAPKRSGMLRYAARRAW